MKTRLRFLVIFVSAVFSLNLQAAEIQSIGFKQSGSQSILEIQGDGPLQFTQSQNQADRQFILDFPEADLGAGATRRLDTSSFNSPVTLVSPYEVEDSGNPRVVIQLRKDVQGSVTQAGNIIRVSFDDPSVATQAKAQAQVEPQGFANSPSANQASSQAPAPPARNSASQGFQRDFQRAAQNVEAPLSELPKPGGKNITQFENAQKTKQFTGKAITIQVREADVRDVLRLISEASGFNIIVGPQVAGKISLSLVDVPWDQALDVVLQTLKLGAERNANILRVLTLANLTAQKRAEFEASNASKKSAPKVTRVFPISYAKPGDLTKILTDFGKSGKDDTVTASIAVDQRTNSIIVQDIIDNIERMTRLIELLDTQTPQVLIEAKVVEATENFSRNFSGNLGIGSADSAIGAFGVSTNGGNPLDQLVGGTLTGTGFAGSTQNGGGVGVSPTLSFLPNDLVLNALLNVSEAESELKVISSPRTVVLNKETASILQTTPVLIPVTTVDEGVITTAFQKEEAKLSLEATPTVTNDEGVLMKLQISRDVVTDAGPESAVGQRNINTNVLVQNGSTLVIGGIYTSDETKSTTGFPFLKDIPIFGVMFGTDNKQYNRSELFIFITPKILNTRKAGLAS